MTTLHLAGLGPITKDFFSFLEQNLNCTNHELLSIQDVNAWPELKVIRNISSPNKYWWLIKLWTHANRADKIILHGLWGWPLVLTLALNPWLLKRCYWVIWGGDLYYYNQRNKGFKSNSFEILRRIVIKRIGHLVTYIDGDVELARQWYEAKGKYHECIMYPSNVYEKHELPDKKNKTINIQVGNSADPSNNHFEIFDKLIKFRDQNIAIYAPLSYGNSKYAKLVKKEGVNRFGDKFAALTELTPLDDYLKFLSKIDIAIFNHKRQQGMGNTINLLGLGKKVYMRSDVTPWKMFEKIGVKVYNIATLDLTPIDQNNKNLNESKIQNHFSRENLITGLSRILNEQILRNTKR